MSDGKKGKVGESSIDSFDELVTVAFVGSRKFPFLFMIEEVMDRVGRCTIVTGGALGVDDHAEKAADALGYNKIIIPVTKEEWKERGKAAGPMRNTKLVELAEAAMVFWDGESRGTQDFMRKAKKKKIPMVVFQSGGNPPQITIHTYRMEIPGEQGQFEIPSIAKAVAEGHKAGPTGTKKKSD